MEGHWFQLPSDLRDFDKLQEYIYSMIIGNNDGKKTAPDGRTVYWDDQNGLIVIVDPNKPPGSAYQPDRGSSYFEDWPDVGPPNEVP